MSLTPKTLLNKRYRIESILGQGGMSSVYRAYDENIGVPVAVKENLVLTDDYAKQFQREASILATLRHPNLPRVSDYFQIHGQGQYLVMDFIEGEDLRERIERLQQLPEKEVILIGAAICDALMYLHRRKPPVIHRDIKPGNIKITPEGHVILVDFGLVKLLEGNQQTTTGARAMTPGYSPPEQYGGSRTDERSDIYSLGATLYAALTGVIPEDGLSRLTGKLKLTPIKKKRPHISPGLATVIEKALEIESNKRYQSAEEFRLALLDAGNLATIPKDSGLVTPPPPQKIRSHVIQTGMSQPVINVPISVPINNKRKNLIWIFPVIILLIISSLIWEYRFNGFSNLMNGYLLNIQANSLPTQTISSDIIQSPTATKYATATLLAQTEKETSLPTQEKTPTHSTEIPLIVETPVPEVTPIGGGQGLIAFASNRDGDVMQIWLMESDGSKERPITQIPDGACQPAWSPDGSKIAFISPCKDKIDLYEGSKIYILDLSVEDDYIPLPIPSDPGGDFDPSWSPDGTKIAFSSLRPGTDPTTKEQLIHIFVYDFTDGFLDEVTDTRWKDRQPSWSPDGLKIAFVRKLSSNEIWWMDSSGQNVERFGSSESYYDNYPTWAKNGNIIFYSRQSSERGIPILVGKRTEDAGAPVEFRIPPTSQPDISPVAKADVSPDGNWFVFESWPDGNNHDIYLATINGANLMRLTTDSSFDFDAVWQPIN